jgi:hypothetical protein
MAKDKNKHQTGGASLNNLATGIADTARVITINKAMKDYTFNNSILHPSPTEYLLAQLLGVDESWITLFDGVYSGALHGSLLVGVQDHPAVILAQAMITQRYGLVEHPTNKDEKLINHPIIEAKKKQFREQGYKSCC